MADPSTNTEMVRVPILGENGRISDDYVPQEIPDSVATVTQKATEAAQSASAASASASAASESANAAATSETNAADSAKDASDAATDATNQATAAKGHSDTAKSYSDSASQSALAASGYVTDAAQSASEAATSATAAAGSASAASGSAANAATSESNAATSAANAAGSASDASGYATSASNSATAAADSANDALESKNQAQQILDEADAKFIEGATATTLAPSAPATATVVDNILQLGIPKGDTGTGIPDGGSAGQVVKKTADGTEWAYDTGAVYNSEEGLQEMSEDGTNDPIYNFGITQGGMSASMSVMGDSPEVAADYSASSTSYRNAIGADANGPYVDLNLSGESGGATKYRYIDDVNDMPSTDGIPTAKAAYAAAKGNVLSGTKSGVIASADDAYAAKPRKLTVYGATRQNLWVNPSGMLNGVTVTSNADGSLTLSGTNAGNGGLNSPVIYTLKPNTTYTVSVDKVIVVNDSPSSSASCSFVVTATGGVTASGSNIHFGYTGALSTTFTTDADISKVTCQFYCASDIIGSEISGTYRVMLNEGDTAQPWCPPGLNSVDELSVVTAGKNLLNEEMSGIEYTANMGVSINIPCPTSLSRQTVVASVYKDGKKLPFNNSSSTFGLYIGVTDSSSNSAGNIIQGAGKADTVTLGDVVAGSTIRFVANSSFSDQNCNIDVQLELGTTATAYEPPNVTTTPIDLDGNALCSLPDGTHDELTIDATGAVTLVKRTQTIQLGGDGTWFKTDSPFVYYTSPWSQYDGSPSGYSSDRHFVDKLPASAVVANGLYSANTNGSAVYLREPTFASDVADVKEWMGANKPVVILPLLEPQTISLPAVTLPTLPAPTFNVYADTEASGTGYAMAPDVGVEYERDVNIAYEQLEAKISALTVAQATS